MQVLGITLEHSKLPIGWKSSTVNKLISVCASVCTQEVHKCNACLSIEGDTHTHTYACMYTRTHDGHTHIHTHTQLILAATEQFNKKPSHGITFLQERGVLHTPLLPTEVADFLLDNPRLDKAMIGEYVGDRRNAKFLEAFVR